jgi:3-phenylpropionate/trans-cinnamate dioxygenase ferredoxin reductase subunit
VSAAGTVIIGGGQAASQLAASMREQGYAEAICIVSAEDALPYQRPPLSKAYLKGSIGNDSLPLRAQTFYDRHVIELLRGEAATRVDRSQQTVHFASGRALAYDHLVFATGSRNRKLALPGAELDGIYYLRSIADAEAIKARLHSTSRVAVIGGGFVGLELACVMRDLGASVVVVEATRRPMGRAVSQIMSQHLTDGHVSSGLRVMLGASVAGFRGSNGHVVGVDVPGEPLIEADIVLVGIGALPEMELARDCGLATSNGIEVDEFLATLDPRISAIGDCAFFASPAAGRRLRLESVQNAVDHARTLGATLAGKRKAYSSVPWFWSDQGAHRVQIAGLTDGHDSVVVRGDRASGKFSLFCYAGDALLGVESVNQASDHMISRRLLASAVGLAREQAADLSFDLKSHVLAAERMRADA